MGIVVEINAYYDWNCVYFVQCLDENKAKLKAYEMAKESFSCRLPDSLEDAEKNDGISINILANVDQIVL